MPVYEPRSAKNAWIDGSVDRTLARAAGLLARSCKPRYAGTAMASRMPRMMMTTRSSISVKPLSSDARRFWRRVTMTWGFLPGWVAVAVVARSPEVGAGGDIDPPGNPPEYPFE